MNDGGVQVFRPTREEFRNFPAFIRQIEEKCRAQDQSIAKVIPPSCWYARKQPIDVDNSDFVIPCPVEQRIVGQKGCLQQLNVVQKKMTVKAFKTLADSTRYHTPDFVDHADLERKYWSNCTFTPPVYGADLEGSFFDEEVNDWNVSRLGTILDMVMQDSRIRVSGVNTPYLYFGMWKATFPWHVEDMDLYSINYIHQGAPKIWYAIHARDKLKFERVAADLFPQLASDCDAFLRHKTTLLSPARLRAQGIEVLRMVHNEGEFMLTFPGGYHSGFNAGFNVAEATNFASERWIDFGKVARLCYCSSSAVRIDMDAFVKRFQPNQYADWLKEKGLVGLLDKAKGVKRASQPDGVSTNGHVCIKQRRSDESCSSSPTSSRIDALGIDVSQLWPPDAASGGSSSGEMSMSPVRDFNARLAKEEPHCSVCQPFVSHALTDPCMIIPSTSRRVLREVCFTRNPARDSTAPESRTDALLQCASCRTVVHASCYRLQKMKQSDNHDRWVCDGCSSDASPPTCILCCMRGGALLRCHVRTDTCDACDDSCTASYAHALCALMIRNAMFSPLQPYPSTAKNSVRLHIVRATHDFPCLYCWRRSGVSGETVLCSLAACTSAAHATCAAYLAEDSPAFEIREWPLCTALSCNQHVEPSLDTDESRQQNLKIGDAVLASCQSKTNTTEVCLRHGVIMGSGSESLCVIDFDDGCFSTNSYLNDIESCSCCASSEVTHKHHVSGSRVQIRWSDRELYAGTFRRSYRATVYDIKLDDGTTTQSTRDDIQLDKKRKKKKSNQ